MGTIRQGGGDAIANPSGLSSIPQKVDSDIKTKILKRDEKFPISFAKNQRLLERDNPCVSEGERTVDSTPLEKKPQHL